MAKNKKMMEEEMNMDMEHDHSGECCSPSMLYHHHRGHGFVKFSAGLLFLVLAVFVGMQLGNPWYKNIRAEFTSQPYARTITVDGEGKVTVKPDIARISLSVASAGTTVKAVTDDNNAKMNAVIAEIKKLGIKPEDIQTSGYDLYPQYDYNPPVVYDKNGAVIESKTPRILGYNLTQTVAVKVKDLSKTDQVLDNSIKAGANQVGSLVFDLDDASQVKKDARKMAFDKAREKGQEMANAAGVKLGRVVTFSEGFGGYPVPYANYAMKAMDVSAEAGVAASVEAGSKEFGVNVSITYEIE